MSNNETDLLASLRTLTLEEVNARIAEIDGERSMLQTLRLSLTRRDRTRMKTKRILDETLKQGTDNNA